MHDFRAIPTGVHYEMFNCISTFNSGIDGTVPPSSYSLFFASLPDAVDGAERYRDVNFKPTATIAS